MDQRKKRVLMVQEETEPSGGREAVFAWILNTLCVKYDVTVISWNASVNVSGFDRQYGTSLEGASFQMLRPPMHLRVLHRLVVTLDSDPGSIQPALLLMRATKRLSGLYDLCIGGEMESDMGAPGIQYIHYPWLEQFSQVMAENDGLGRWGRLCRLFQGRIRPWMLVGDFSYARMCANHTLTNSDWTGRRIHDAYGIDATTLYPPGAGSFPDIPWVDRSNGFLCIGRIHPQKRADWLIEALEPLRSSIPDLHLYIVGKIGDKPAELEYYRSLEQAHERCDWITIHPDITRCELEELAAKQRYGLHAMVDEHFGMAVAEMVRAGCIPFIHNSGGAVEIVNRDSRLLYKTGSELREKVLHVHTSPKEQSTLRKDLKQGASRFSVEAFSAQVRSVVESCLTVTR